MKIDSFRVQSFRSIADSGWQSFSPDGVTVLVGQNESGKSSVLEALSLACRSGGQVNPRDLRVDHPLPKVSVRGQVERGELADLIADSDSEVVDYLLKQFADSDFRFEISSDFVNEGGRIVEQCRLVSPVLLPGMTEDLRGSLSDEDASTRKALEDAEADLVEELINSTPYFSLYLEERSSLPDQIDLTDDAGFGKQLGASGAQNFVDASGLSLVDVLNADDRRRSTLIARANKSINQELSSYWSQYIGGDKKIEIECEFSRYPPSDPSKAAKPYLSFWVHEGEERFHPSQRSRGTRWFISMFLHLLATKKASSNHIILLDEPGAYLHEKAQADVARLIQRIAEDCPIVYSTHSPTLVDFDRLYRVLAVERVGESESSDTVIQRALKLASVSSDTLSPVLTRMGADMRHQSVIKKSGNVLLEEPSAHFYLRGLAQLVGEAGRDLSFLSATGVNNVPTLFAMLVAWGLGFAVLVDDDSQARDVRKQLVRDWFAGSDEEADKKIVRLKACNGIEDAFTRAEFQHLVLKNEFEIDESTSNSAFVKKMRLKKPVLAYEFWLRVERGEILPAEISQETNERFSRIFAMLAAASGLSARN